jgi:hypothetical protein
MKIYVYNIYSGCCIYIVTVRDEVDSHAARRLVCAVQHLRPGPTPTSLLTPCGYPKNAERRKDEEEVTRSTQSDEGAPRKTAVTLPLPVDK